MFDLILVLLWWYFGTLDCLSLNLQCAFYSFCSFIFYGIPSANGFTVSNLLRPLCGHTYSYPYFQRLGYALLCLGFHITFIWIFFHESLEVNTNIQYMWSSLSLSLSHTHVHTRAHTHERFFWGMSYLCLIGSKIYDISMNPLQWILSLFASHPFLKHKFRTEPASEI